MKYFKKSISALLVFAMTVSFFGCSAATPTPAPATPASAPAAETPAQTSPQEAEVTLSLNHVGSLDHPYHFGSVRFAELVEKNSNGAVKVDVFPASQIASGAKAVEFIQMGTLDIALESTMAFGNFVSEIGVLDLPFVFDSKEQAFALLDGEVGEALEAAAESKGFKVLAWWDNGFRNISNTKRPITKPEDLKGLKIRVPESKIFLATFEALGAVPTPMALSEVFTAMQLGTVDGQENAHTFFLTNKYYEVNQYYSVTNHIFSAEPLIMSTDKFDSLSAEQQRAILDAAKEAGIYQRELSAELDNKNFEELKKVTANVNIVEDLPEFQKAVQPVYDKFDSEYGTYLKMILDAKKK